MKRLFSAALIAASLMMTGCSSMGGMWGSGAGAEPGTGSPTNALPVSD